MSFTVRIPFDKAHNIMGNFVLAELYRTGFASAGFVIPCIPCYFTAVSIDASMVKV